MMYRLRKIVRDVFAPGGVRRHPFLWALVVLVVAAVAAGLSLRPL